MDLKTVSSTEYTFIYKYVPGTMLHQLNEHSQELSCQLYLNKAEKKNRTVCYYHNNRSS